MTDHVVAGGRLKRELERSAEMAGCTIDFVAQRDSALPCNVFSCGQHCLRVLVGGASGQAWLDTLDEYSLYLPGYVLVQLAVGTIEPHGEQLLVEIEAQTVKEA